MGKPTAGGRVCAACGVTVLSRYNPEPVCAECVRAAREPTGIVPAWVWDSVPLRTALAQSDLAAFALLVRRASRLPMHEFVAPIGMSWSVALLSMIENGQRGTLYDLRKLFAFTDALGMPRAKLAPLLFGDPTATLGGGTSTVTAVPGRGDSGMRRRNFVGHVSGLALGLAAGLDIDRLLALLPQAGSTGTRRIGVADVEVIEQLVTEFVRHDFAHGSELMKAAAIEQVRTVLPLLDNAQVAPELRPRLMLAAARLAMQAGWMNFDSNDQEAARRLWLIGLGIARNTDHPQATDLTVYLLQDMAFQAVHLNRPDETLGLIRISETTATGPHPVSASTACNLATTQARAHATRGDANACERALGQAGEHFTTIDPSNLPPWGSYVGEIGLAARQGIAYYTLALPGQDARTASRAVPLLDQAVTRCGPGYAKLGGLWLADLAGAHALSGDVGTAVTVGHQAIDAVTAVSSSRARSRLHLLSRVLEPLHDSPGVAELRDRLATAA